ncbi:MAG: hypothetical protein ABIP74_02240 [Candidatus Saccharimonas sp.]
MTVLAYREWVAERVAQETLPPFWQAVRRWNIRYHLVAVLLVLAYSIVLWCMYDIVNATTETALPLSFILFMVLISGIFISLLASPMAWLRYSQRLTGVMQNMSEEAYRFYCSYLEQTPENRWPASAVADGHGPTRDELLAIAGYDSLYRRFSRHRVMFGIAGLAVLLSGTVMRRVFNMVPDMGLVMVAATVGLVTIISALIMAPREEDVEQARERFATHLSWEQRYSAQRTLPV